MVNSTQDLHQQQRRSFTLATLTFQTRQVPDWINIMSSDRLWRFQQPEPDEVCTKATSKANLTKMIETFFKNQETPSDKNKKLHYSFQWFQPIKVPSIIANMAIIGVFCENWWWSTAKIPKTTHNWNMWSIMPRMRTSVDKQYQH